MTAPDFVTLRHVVEGEDGRTFNAEEAEALQVEVLALLREWGKTKGLYVGRLVSTSGPPLHAFTLTAPNGQRVAFSSPLRVRDLLRTIPAAAGEAVLSPELLDSLAVGAQWGHIEAEGWTVEMSGEEEKP